MIPGGPIQTYLKALRRQLPYPAPRLLAETREHLLEATSDRIAEGRDEAEAERLAVAGYGRVEEVVASVLAEGRPVMSPRLLRWFMPIAMMLSLPTAIFIWANVIEHLAGSDGSEGVFGSTFDSWGARLEALLVLGPMAAFGLMVLSSVRLHREREVAGLHATLELKMSRATVVTTVLIGAVVAAVIAYGILENL